MSPYKNYESDSIESGKEGRESSPLARTNRNNIMADLNRKYSEGLQVTIKETQGQVRSPSLRTKITKNKLSFINEYEPS